MRHIRRLHGVIRSGIAFWMQDFVLSNNCQRRWVFKRAVAALAKTIGSLSRVASERFFNQFGKTKQIVIFAGRRIT